MAVVLEAGTFPREFSTGLPFDAPASQNFDHFREALFFMPERFSNDRKQAAVAQRTTADREQGAAASVRQSHELSVLLCQTLDVNRHIPTLPELKLILEAGQNSCEDHDAALCEKLVEVAELAVIAERPDSNTVAVALAVANEALFLHRQQVPSDATLHVVQQFASGRMKLAGESAEAGVEWLNLISSLAFWNGRKDQNMLDSGDFVNDLQDNIDFICSAALQCKSTAKACTAISRAAFFLMCRGRCSNAPKLAATFGNVLLRAIDALPKIESAEELRANTGRAALALSWVRVCGMAIVQAASVIRSTG